MGIVNGLLPAGRSELQFRLTVEVLARPRHLGRSLRNLLLGDRNVASGNAKPGPRGLKIGLGDAVYIDTLRLQLLLERAEPGFEGLNVEPIAGVVEPGDDVGLPDDMALLVHGWPGDLLAQVQNRQYTPRDLESDLFSR